MTTNVATTADKTIRTGSHSAGRRPRHTSFSAVDAYFAGGFVTACVVAVAAVLLGAPELADAIATVGFTLAVIYLVHGVVGMARTSREIRINRARREAKANFDMAFRLGYERRRLDEHREWLDNFTAEQDAKRAERVEVTRWRETMGEAHPFDQEK